MLYSIRTIVIGTIAALTVVLLILFITYSTLLSQEKEQNLINHARTTIQQLQPAAKRARDFEAISSAFAEKDQVRAAASYRLLRKEWETDAAFFSQTWQLPVENKNTYSALNQQLQAIRTNADSIILLAVGSSQKAMLQSRNDSLLQLYTGTISELEIESRNRLNQSYNNSIELTRKTFGFVRVMLIVLLALMLIGFYVVFKDIRHSKMANKQLREFNTELERKVQEQTAQLMREKNLSDSIINSLPGVFFLQDSKGNYLRWNKELEKISGYSHEEISQLNALDFFEASDQQMILASQEQVFRNGQTSIEAFAITKEKQKIPFYFSGQLIEYEGKPCVIGTGIDISERKKIEEENEKVSLLLKERVKELSTLYKVSQVLQTEEKSIPVLMQEIVQIIPQGFQHSEMSEARIQLGVMEFTSTGFTEGIHSQKAVFNTTDGVKGAVEVTYRKEVSAANGQVFMNEEKDLLKMLAEMIRIFLAKKHETEELRKSEANLHAIFDTTDTIYILLDTSFRIISYNQQAVDFCRNELKQELYQLKNDFMDYFSPDRRPVLTPWLKEAKDGNHVSYETSYIQPDQSVHWYSVKMFPILGADKKMFGLMLAIQNTTAQKLLEQEILDKEVQEQKNIIREVLKTQENERNKIGQELHDNVNQILASTKLYLNMAISDHPENLHFVKTAVEYLDQAISEIRTLSSKEVTPLREIKLKELLYSLTESINYNSPVKARLNYKLPASIHIDEDLKLNIYRIVQEQLNNILKHASAQTASVTVEEKNGSIALVIADDGVGFDPLQRRKGIGISNMINRVESYNGEISITSKPGDGCCISIRIPV